MPLKGYWEKWKGTCHVLPLSAPSYSLHVFFSPLPNFLPSVTLIEIFGSPPPITYQEKIIPPPNKNVFIAPRLLKFGTPLKWNSPSVHLSTIQTISQSVNQSMNQWSSFKVVSHSVSQLATVYKCRKFLSSPVPHKNLLFKWLSKTIFPFVLRVRGYLTWDQVLFYFILIFCFFASLAQEKQKHLIHSFNKLSTAPKFT